MHVIVLLYMIFNGAGYVSQKIIVVFLFTLLAVSSFVFAQGIPGGDAPGPPTVSDSPAVSQEDLPYELGVVLVQYDEETFQSNRVSEDQDDSIEVPGGLLDGPGTGPVSTVNEFLVSEGFEPEVTDIFYDLNAEVIHIGEGVDPLSVMGELIKVSGVVLVQPNFLYEFDQANNPFPPFNDPDLGRMWHLEATKVYLPPPSAGAADPADAWDSIDGLDSTTRTHVPTIAVIDTGITLNHPEFQDTSGNNSNPELNRIAALSNCKLPIFSGMEESNPLSFTTLAGGCPYGGYDFYDDDANPRHLSNDGTHGTSVAGIAAANRNNNQAGAGVAHFAHLAPIRVAEGRRGSFDSVAILKSIAFARLNNIDIINGSFGALMSGTRLRCDRLLFSDPSSYYYLLEHQQLENFDGIFVVAAGNNDVRTGNGGSSWFFPADLSQSVSSGQVSCWPGLSNVISVGGTEKRGEDEVHWSDSDGHGSNFNPGIDIAAPSEDILVLRGSSSVLSAGRGTSYAAPQVAGVAALMKWANNALTGEQLKTMLIDSADQVADLAGFDCEVGTSDDLVNGARRLNAHNAVLAALATAEDPVEYVNQRTISEADRTECLRGGGRDSDGDGLLDIVTVVQLNNMRYNLEGTSYKTGSEANNRSSTVGCPTASNPIWVHNSTGVVVTDDPADTVNYIKRAGCYGYELMNDLDFSGSILNDYSLGFQPIDDFSGVFDGNNHTVRNLRSIRVSGGGRIFGTNINRSTQIKNAPSFVGELFWGCSSNQNFCWLDGGNRCCSPIVNAGEHGRPGIWVNDSTIDSSRNDFTTGAGYASCYRGSWNYNRSLSSCNRGCRDETKDYCMLVAGAHDSTSGSCTSGNAGESCSYECNQGTWVEVTNTCTAGPPRCSAKTQASTTWTDNGVSCVSTTGGLPGTNAGSPGIERRDESGTHTGSATFTCSAGGSWETSNRSCGGGCGAGLENGCSFRAASHDKPISGSCADGYTGSCSAICDNGIRTSISNTCTATTCPTQAQSSTTWTDNGVTCVSTTGGLSGTTPGSPGIERRDESGTHTGSVTFTCSAGGSWETSNRSCGGGCGAGLENGCSFRAASHDKPISGSCADGYTGSCSATCDNSIRTSILNTCTAVACTTPLGTLSTTATQEGTWASGCASVSRSGKYAQYYTFTLSAEKEVTIDLVSSQDTYLHLHTYSATAANHVGSRITFNDDGGENRNARIIRTLSAGTYTIEATTFSDSIVGSFTLIVTPTTCANTCTYSDWTPAATSKCSGTVAQTRTNTTVNACPGLSCTAVNGSVVATGTCGAREQCNANGVCGAIISCPATASTSWDGCAAGGLPATLAGTRYTVRDTEGVGRGTYTGRATFRCRNDGTWNTVPANSVCNQGCNAQTENACSLSAGAHEATSGTCANGGSCSYRCTSGTWIESSNTCSCPTDTVRWSQTSSSCSTSISSATHDTFINPVIDDTGPVQGFTSFRCEKGSWTQDGVLITCAPTVCSTATENHCSLRQTQHGGTSGTCETGTTGTCSYSCNIKTWNEILNTCTATTCPTQAQSSTTWTDNGVTCVSTTGGLSGTTPGSPGIERRDESGTHTGSATFTCSAGGSWETSNRSCGRGCGAGLENGCSFRAASHNKPISGSCADGYTGSCSATCDNGTRVNKTNTCVSETCTSHSDCSSSQVCNIATERCVNSGNPSSCASSSDCGTGESCVSHTSSGYTGGKPRACCPSGTTYWGNTCGAPCPAETKNNCSLSQISYGYYASARVTSCATGYTGSCGGAYQCTTNGGPFSIRDADLNTCTVSTCTCTYSDWTPAATSKCSGTVAQSRTNTTANACTGLTCTDTTRVVTATGTCGAREQCNANGVCGAIISCPATASTSWDGCAAGGLPATLAGTRYTVRDTEGVGRGTYTGRATFRCRNDGTWNTVPANSVCSQGCNAQTENACSLSAGAYEATSGTCANGGSCSYRCTFGTWIESSNTCSCPTDTVRWSQTSSSCSTSISSATHDTFINPVIDDTGPVQGFTSFRCEKGSWTQDGVLITCAPTVCSTATENHCSLRQTQHGGTSGTCETGTTGTCSYSCNIKTWNEILNTCTTPTPINGVCGSARDTCTAGRYRNLRDSNSYYRWRCDGTNGGTNSRACLFEKCGSWSDTYCANDGRRLRQVRTCGSRTEYQTIQTCSNGCSGSACNPDPTNGVCGSARNTCTAGTPNDNAVTDTNTYYRWRCDGLNGGANSGTCQKQKGCTRHSQCSGSLYCSACNSSGNCTGTGTCQACTWGNLWCNAADTKVKQSCKVNGQGSSKRYRTVETCSSGTICDGGQCVAECLVNPCSANCRSSVTWGFCHNGHTHGGSGYVHNQRQRHGWYTCHGSTTKRWKSADC